MTEIEKPDMSFTLDPEWLKQREALWEHYCDFQYDEVRKDKLKVYREYFFSGDLQSPQDHGQKKVSFLRSRVDTFPLRTPEGWGYVIYKFGGFDRSKKEMTDLLVYQVLASLTYRGWSLEEELALWDYFLPETYQPVVQSPVTTKRQKGPIEGKLSVDDVIGQFAGKLYSIFSGLDDVSLKYFYKAEFILSTLASVTPSDLESFKYLRSSIVSLFEVPFRSRSGVVNGVAQLDMYVDRFKAGMETLEFDPTVKTLWENVKRDYSQ